MITTEDLQSESREGCLSVARTALFFIDLLAMQEVLQDRRLITPEVESIVAGWATANDDSLRMIASRLPGVALAEPAHLEAWRASLETLIDGLVEQLPAQGLEALPVAEPPVLSQAS
jgi:hypothetical protein